jgi:hypothetical protein
MWKRSIRVGRAWSYGRACRQAYARKGFSNANVRHATSANPAMVCCADAQSHPGGRQPQNVPPSSTATNRNLPSTAACTRRIRRLTPCAEQVACLQATTPHSQRRNPWSAARRLTNCGCVAALRQPCTLPRPPLPLQTAAQPPGRTRRKGCFETAQTAPPAQPPPPP